MRKNIIIGIALVAAAVLFFAPYTTTTSTTTTIQTAYAAGAMGTLDQNGLMRYDPLSDYSMAVGDEYYTFIKNFRSDGSMRMDFKGHDTDSLMIAGYFNVEKGGGSEPDCTRDPDEEISAKMNGGPHNDVNPTWADTMDLGIVDFEADDARFRTEETHPDYSGTYPGQTTTWPFTSSQSLCNVGGGWVGVAAYKINLDSNCDGTDDRVTILGFIDKSGLGADGKPQNNWQRTYKQTFAEGSLDLKSIFEPYVQTIGEADETYQTIRIDDQSRSAWTTTNVSNQPYKFVTLKEIINIQKDTC